MSINSADIAASIDAHARELSAAARLYQNLQYANREATAAGLESLKAALDYDWLIFLRKRAEEAAHAPQK